MESSSLRRPALGLHRRAPGRLTRFGALPFLLFVGASSAQATEISASELDRLRSLGYGDFAEEEAVEGEQPVVHFDTKRSQPGYNLVISRGLCLAELIDPLGRVVHSWQRDGTHWSNAELTVRGDLVVHGARDAGRGNRTLRLSWGGAPRWEKRLFGHHDIDVLPDGGLLFPALDRRVLPGYPDATVLDDRLIFVDPDSRSRKRRSLYDMIERSEGEILRIQEVASVDGRVDLLHTNSVELLHDRELAQRDPIYRVGNVLVSMRNQDAVAIFDPDGRRIVWAWGRGELLGPHDASMLENGHVLIFDNGLGRKWSRVVEVDPIERRIVWEYRNPEPRRFYSPYMGSAQRLANGNTLIAESSKGQAFEVTRSGEIVWHWRNPHTNEEGARATIVRIKRYPLGFIEEKLRARAKE